MALIQVSEILWFAQINGYNALPFWWKIRSLNLSSVQLEAGSILRLTQGPMFSGPPCQCLRCVFPWFDPHVGRLQTVFFVGEDYDVTQSAQFEVMDVEAVDLSHLGTLNSTVGQWKKPGTGSEDLYKSQLATGICCPVFQSQHRMTMNDINVAHCSLKANYGWSLFTIV